jgi:hypothetical protein
MTKYKSRSHSNRKKNSRNRSCSGGMSSRRGRGRGRGRDKKNKNGTRKWNQKGCQSGGGSMTGGSPWGSSDVQHIGGGGGIGGMSQVPQSINGNHYPLNTTTLNPPHNSNHDFEKLMFGGKKKHSQRRGRRHRKYIGEQHGGMAEYLPETANTSLRGITETPACIANALQGDPTAFVTSNPTVQPIAQPVQLI